MSRIASAMPTRLLLAAELLLILGWIWLLFQWHAPATANAPVPVSMPAAEYRALRQNIDAQLRDNRSMEAGEGTLESAFWQESDLEQVFLSPAREEAQPVEVPTGIAISSPNSREPAAVSPEREQLPAVGRQEPLETPRSGTPACPYRVSSIISGSSRATVVLVNTVTGESLFLGRGQHAGEWTVAAITDTTVVLQHDGRQRVLAVE